jgi:hypothetical protein
MCRYRDVEEEFLEATAGKGFPELLTPQNFLENVFGCKIL